MTKTGLKANLKHDLQILDLCYSEGRYSEYIFRSSEAPRLRNLPMEKPPFAIATVAIANEVFAIEKPGQIFSLYSFFEFLPIFEPWGVRG